MTFQELMGVYQINDDLGNQSAYQALVKQMQNRVTPVIGAGLSVWAGYPTWSKLLTEKASGTSVEQEVRDLLAKEAYEQAASRLEGFYRTNRFRSALRSAFDPAKLREAARPAYQRRIPRLFPGPVVTTNYDVSLDRLLNAPFVVTPESDFQDTELRSRIQKHERMLVKLHGTVDDPAHMILTEQRYNETYGADPQHPDLSLPLPKALQSVFNGAPPLFLGCGLGPDRTCAVLHACKGASGFALLELPPETENPDEPCKPKLFQGDGAYLPAFAERLDFLDGLELQVIWYPYKKHEAVGVLLEQLAKDLLPPDAGEALRKLEEQQYHGSAHFLGRDAQVRELADALQNPAVKRLLVYGVAGIGKTEICKAAYRTLKQADPAFTMSPVDLTGASSMSEVLSRLSLALGFSAQDLGPDQLLPGLLRWLASAGRGAARPLVWLDNFEEVWLKAPAERNALSDALFHLSAAGLRFLISSQVRIPADRTLEVRTLDGRIGNKELDKMDWERFRKLDRVRLFLATLGREVRGAEHSALRTLMGEMEGHPLSIVLTAS